MTYEESVDCNYTFGDNFADIFDLLYFQLSLNDLECGTNIVGLDCPYCDDGGEE
jgi:hypothetical protein